MNFKGRFSSFKLNDLTVTGDNTWQKQFGHNSYNGVTFIGDPYLNTIFDYQTESRYCYKCKGNQGITDCECNYRGTANLCHYLSTDKNPMHNKCPVGIDSWCKYQRALFVNEEFKHPCKLSDEDYFKIKPVLDKLTDNGFLKLSEHHKSQNSQNYFDRQVALIIIIILFNNY